jgi:hypothetical protein
MSNWTATPPVRRGTVLPVSIIKSPNTLASEREDREHERQAAKQPSTGRNGPGRGPSTCKSSRR